MKSDRARAALGGVIAAMMVAATAVLGAPAASAAPIIPDLPADGTLHIHKHQTPADAVPGDGLEVVPDLTNPPVPGIVFTVTPLDFDLRTNAGWVALTAMEIDDYATHQLSAAQVLPPTDADGLVTVTLPVGAYYVEETGFGPGVTPVAPFIVTLPMTHPDDLDTWVYDVHVYPKNAVTPPPVKGVLDEDVVTIGQDLDFVVTSEIPEVPTGQTLDGYRVRDVLDSRLAYGSTAVELSTGTPALVAGTHYLATMVGREVLVTFTPDGLTLLQANSAQQVVTTITTQVTEVGEITNTATLFPNEASWNSGTGTGVPSNLVETNWGTIRLTKFEAGAPATLLEGAQFKVYASEEDALADDNPISLPSNPNADDSVWITDATGVLTVAGLRYSTVAGGGEVDPDDDGYRPYWFVETKSPTGYALLAAPIMVVLDQPIVNVPVANPPLNAGFDLPFTGGTGLWLFPIGGALLIGGAFLLLLARRRRNAEQA